MEALQDGPDAPQPQTGEINKERKSKAGKHRFSSDFSLYMPTTCSPVDFMPSSS